jgi:hypothetical protein
MEQGPADLPPFLKSTDGFAAHLSDLFHDEDNEVKGSAFAEFAMRLAPLCDFWKGFPEPQRSVKKTHDKGVDFFAEHDELLERFCGQSKYRIREVGEFDAIISKFESYEKQQAQETVARGGQFALPGVELVRQRAAAKGNKISTSTAPATLRLRFVLVTSTDLQNIIARYRSSGMSSKAYFERLETEQRIQIVDGRRLLDELQDLYRRNYILAPSVEIDLAAGYLHMDPVYVSMISGRTLAALYSAHGSSLFFENIREFLGIPANGEDKGENVNQDIMQTLTTEPHMMLGRNNGITIKADSVKPISDSKLALHNCSIVNGCQTTMCIINVGERAHDAKILVKIVEGGDSWDIAKAANNQNRVTRIDLELARFLRPQLIRKMATDMGFGVPPSEESRTVSNVLETIHRNRVSYEAIRMLYLGIFSRSPANMWASNYSEVRVDVLERFSAENKDEFLLRALFQLLSRLPSAVERVRIRHSGEVYADLLKRFFDDKKQYQCLLGILAACGCVNDSLVKKSPEAQEEYQRLSTFIERLDVILQSAADVFDDVFSHAFVVVADRLLDSGSNSEESTLQQLQQRMYRETQALSSSKQFERMFEKLRLHMRSQDGLFERIPVW